ncbi:XRE family transcriptional regulator [Solwaraspora sp. WMMA2080]|uniref:XRE family transcriptional regulator n=1 Tax=unclassified Solwaraspora TaxID=2627926 RepID=UPI00248B2630|nr:MULTISPECIES: XRE family transcriptional regulator [unclassified Solwaraspora]WBB95062.1 XRE family transcriptional regulator [Solwaraspora sp. WMMA2059]WBC21054.1 XRE family transcriptional regulator [Solwaraspora sp. WMMA2080]
MADSVNFLAMIERLSRIRGQSFDDLMRVAGVDPLMVDAAIKGDVLGQSSLQRLARVLDMHAADLFVVAGIEVPSNLAPLSAPAGPVLDHLVRTALRLPAERLEQLLRVARSVPRRDSVALTVRKRDNFPYGPGSVIVGMLRNRNLNNLNSVKMLYRLAGIGPLSSATIHAFGSGRKELSPDFLAGFAAVLALRGDELAALLDIEPVDVKIPVDVAIRQVAELLWDVRHLNNDQLRNIQEEFGAIN